MREWEGRDLICFTNLLSWRCGLASVSFSVNGVPLETLAIEPCYEGTATPNALMAEDILPYIARHLGSVQTATVSIIDDDDTPDGVSYERKSVLMP